MKLFPNLPHELPRGAEYAVVTVGVFDGVHRGHQKILATALEAAEDKSVALVTFDPHPRAVLGPPKRARLLSPLDERLELLGGWPLGAVAVLRFDQQVARIPYTDFVRTVLLQGLGARRLVLGYNVRLGYQRQGNVEALTALGCELGFEVIVVPACEVDGGPVSSTRIRHLLDAGRVEEAAALLGRPYGLDGTVVRGSGRGRVLGIPTANLQLHPEKLVPANGVYAVRVQVDGLWLRGAMNVGVVPTFEAQGPRSVEVHLLDYAGDLYGTRLRVSCVARLRDEKRFPSPEALLAQIQQDVARARELLPGPS